MVHQHISMPHFVLLSHHSMPPPLSNSCSKYGRRIKLSQGLYGKAIAYSGERVSFTGSNSGKRQSSLRFHKRPDAAGIFPSQTGGFYYVSNSEVSSWEGGGVYVLEFDAKGKIIDYYKTLTSSYNCGGGKTPWGTWVSCEENGSSGQVYQTDPTGKIVARRTSVVPSGGNYESFAYDDRRATPRFFTTEDAYDGPLVRYTPDATGMACYNKPTDEEKWCTLNSGQHDYLRLNSSGPTGTFRWVSNKGSATPHLYPNAEGIDVVNGILFFVSKQDKTLFELDLDAGTFVRTSTRSGAFNLEPDQLKIIDVGSDGDTNNLIYFCEDGGRSCDIHGRDMKNGKYFTIVQGTGYNSETTGLAFSPDAKYMFVSFQVGHQSVCHQFVCYLPHSFKFTCRTGPWRHLAILSC